MKSAALVFPHQLFENNPAFQKGREIFLLEDPLLFGDKVYPAKFHKRKLVYHRSTFKSYEQYLKKKKFNVSYLNYKDLKNKKGSYFHWLKKEKIREIHYSDTVDFILEKRIAKWSKEFSIHPIKYESHNFLNDNEYNTNYFVDKKSYFLTKFYIQQRKRLNILVTNESPEKGKWSFDTENRKKLPKGIEVPDLKFSKNSEFIREAIDYVEKNFPDNPGNTEGAYFPTDHESALKWFDNFLDERFRFYGDYQDAISESGIYLFHSVISPMMNIGLLAPLDVINRALEFARSNSVPMNSLEGFIRQIVGWREFIRAIYVIEGVKQRNSNFWGHENPMPSKFYNATTGIYPIDKTIEKLNNTAYNHHIERLMLLGNFMLLCEINPTEVYKWFMEMYIDAYDWVMVPNVYGMSQFADGGLMSTKPYISSSNYVSKMSDFKKGDWKAIWDALFWRFIFKHREYFKDNPRTFFMSRQLERMNNRKLEDHIKRADNYLSFLFE